MRTVLLTNILSPYRQAFYKELAAQSIRANIEFHVLVMSETESNRAWQYDEYAMDFTELLKKKIFVGRSDTLYINTNLKSRLNELNPDVMILAGGYNLFPVWQALSWAKKKRCKLFFWSESHLNEKREYNKLVFWVRDRVRYNFYSRFSKGGFWCPGKKAYELVEKYAGSGVPYVQVPNVIDNIKFTQVLQSITMPKEELREKYGLSKEKKIFFSSARLTAAKGLLPFLREFARVENHENVQLAVAGDGEQEEQLRAYAEEYSIDLKLLGYRQEAEIIELHYCSDCFFLPSLSDPSPLSCVEALWCGKPLLVSEHVGNYPEAVEEGINGFVFSYEKGRDAENKISKMIHMDSGWYGNAGKRSKEIAEARFHIKKVANSVISDWRKTLNLTEVVE